MCNMSTTNSLMRKLMANVKIEIRSEIGHYNEGGKYHGKNICDSQRRRNKRNGTQRHLEQVLKPE